MKRVLLVTVQHEIHLDPTDVTFEDAVKEARLQLEDGLCNTEQVYLINANWDEVIQAEALL